MQSFFHIHTFLDVNFSINNGELSTDLYTKPTDKQQYLLHSSCHPLHTKRAIPSSLALWLRRMCSTNEAFTLRTNGLIIYLNKRGYKRHFLHQEIRRVHNITRDGELSPKHTPTSTLDILVHVPIVIAYNPALRTISSIIRKHFNILTSSHPCSAVFICSFPT